MSNIYHLRKPKLYHTVCEFINGFWTPQFGDYDVQAAAEEMAEMKRVAPKRRFCLIHTGGSQHEINEGVSAIPAS